MPVCSWWIGSTKFPFLTHQNHLITNDPDGDYNCIAYAAGVLDRWWWPDPKLQDYWPVDLPRIATVNSFVLAYQKLGYSMPSDGTLVPWVDKIALFVDYRNIPTHAARQLPDGGWTSKLGSSHDITHDLNVLNGPGYGTIVLFMHRSRFPLPPTTLPQHEIERLDRYYREGGLRTPMASPHVHYDDPACPRDGCGHRLEWIDFKLGIEGGPGRVYRPLVRAWWDGTGFVGRCPVCGGWVHFTTLGMSAPDDQLADNLPQLPANWAEVAQFA